MALPLLVARNSEAGRCVPGASCLVAELISDASTPRTFVYLLTNTSSNALLKDITLSEDHLSASGGDKTE